VKLESGRRHRRAQNRVVDPRKNARTTPARTLLDAAVQNNAEWCDSMCWAHGLPTERDSAVWSSRSRTPPLYPDAVTLRPRVSANEVLDRIDTGPGCSVKDSFADLDLSAAGFRILFDAQWIAFPSAPPDLDERWEVTRDPHALAEWERAWADGDEPAGLFRPGLLARSNVEFLATRRDGHIVAGALLSRSATVVGLSNLFTASEDLDGAWAGAIAAVATHHPGLPVVGYERGEDLAAALRHGFETIGPLRVWLRTD
jgi:hypothetical protein